MSNLDLNKVSRVHFIGVGGIGMSALARHFLSEKKLVSGSSDVLSDLTKSLSEEGVQVFAEHSEQNITKELDLVVYTEAVTPTSAGWAELEMARQSKIPTMNYFSALGLAMNPYYEIAVAGTHGKTTTTAMLADIFEQAEKDPTAVIGSLRAKTKSNYRAGKSKYAIVEACEYKGDFLHLKPDVLVITNLEHEHVDFYKDLAAVQQSFRQLALQVDEKGLVIADTGDENLAPVLQDLHVPVVNYMDFFDPALNLKQPGVHNRLNAAAALAVAKNEKLDIDEAKLALQNFAGTWRRFEYKGELNEAPVYDDYAHHPTEIVASISGVRELYPDKRLTIVFQPHTYTRTAELFDDFARAVGHADEVIFLPIYSAREVNETGVSSRELSVKAIEFNKNSSFAESFEEAEKTLRANIDQNDVVVVMGAGDVTKLAGDLVK